jgi:hypothetical protein
VTTPTTGEEDRRRRSRAFWRWAIAVVVGCLLVGLLGRWVIDEASGAPARAEAAHRGAAKCVPEDPCSIRHNKRTFKRGRLGHSDRWNVALRDLTRDPAAARRVFITKIRRAIARHARWRGPTARRLYARVANPSGDSQCLSALSYPAWATRPGQCNRYRDFRSGPGLTKGQVQRLGSVTLCGASVALSLYNRPAGAAAQKVMAVVGLGGAGCFWSFWRDIDPG